MAFAADPMARRTVAQNSAYSAFGRALFRRWWRFLTLLKFRLTASLHIRRVFPPNAGAEIGWAPYIRAVLL